MYQRELFISERYPEQIYDDCWILPNILSIEEQKQYLVKCRKWCSNKRLKYWQTPSGLKMNHPFCCIGWNWKPYEYYQTNDAFANCPMDEQLQVLCGRLIKSIPKNNDVIVSASIFNDVPDTAIINWYPLGSSLAAHQDKSEDIQLIMRGSPIWTIAIGDDCIIKVGGIEKADQMKSILMKSGDCFLMYGSSRLRYHAVTKIIPNTAPLELDIKPGRISITARRAKL